MNSGYTYRQKGAGVTTLLLLAALLAVVLSGVDHSGFLTWPVSEPGGAPGHPFYCRRYVGLRGEGDHRGDVGVFDESVRGFCMVTADSLRPFQRMHNGVLIYLQLDEWVEDVPLPRDSTIEDGCQARDKPPKVAEQRGDDDYDPPGRRAPLDAG